MNNSSPISSGFNTKTMPACKILGSSHSWAIHNLFLEVALRPTLNTVMCVVLMVSGSGTLYITAATVYLIILDSSNIIVDY